jgi:hypothetical protein
MTGSACFKLDATSADQNVFSKWRTDGSGHAQYSLSFIGAGNKLRAHIFDTAGAADVIDSIETISSGKWYHGVFVKNGSLLSLYLNGRYQGSVSSTKTMVSRTAATFMVSRRADGSSDPLAGRIAEVALWDVALNQEEITTLSRAISATRIRPSRSRGYWKLDDYPSSGGAKDYSLNANHLALSGAVPLAPSPEIDGGVVTYLPTEAPAVIAGVNYTDAATVYLDLQPSGIDEYSPPCFIIGEGEAQLRWSAGDDYLRWLADDADLRWEASMRLGTGQC